MIIAILLSFLFSIYITFDVFQLADYSNDVGFADGYIYAFLKADKGLVFVRDAHESIADATTNEDTLQALFTNGYAYYMDSIAYENRFKVNVKDIELTIIYNKECCGL